jgi:hypothetical protein
MQSNPENNNYKNKIKIYGIFFSSREFPHTKFTISTWMRHRAREDVDKHRKEHIICKADDHRKFRDATYSVFQGFSKAKSVNGGSILSLSQFLILPQLTQKIKLASKVVKVD